MSEHFKKGLVLKRMNGVIGQDMTVVNPELMRTLATLAEEGSFSRTGERLGLSQQAISAQIKKIESAIDRQIASRRGGRIRLTNHGEALLAYARQVFAVSRSAERHFARVDVTGLVRIGLTEDFVIAGLPMLLTSLRDKQPLLQMVVECGQTETLLLRQDNENLDLVIGIQRAGGTRGHVLWSDCLEWVGDTSMFTERRTIRLLTLPEPSITRKLAIEALTRHGLPYQVVFESDSRPSIRAAAMSGLGIALFCRTLDTDIVFNGKQALLPKVDLIEIFISVSRSDNVEVIDVFKSAMFAISSIRKLKEQE